jgi:hypothetical protein
MPFSYAVLSACRKYGAGAVEWRVRGSMNGTLRLSVNRRGTAPNRHWRDSELDVDTKLRWMERLAKPCQLTGWRSTGSHSLSALTRLPWDNKAQFRHDGVHQSRCIHHTGPDWPGLLDYLYGAASNMRVSSNARSFNRPSLPVSPGKRNRGRGAPPGHDRKYLSRQLPPKSCQLTGKPRSPEKNRKGREGRTSRRMSTALQGSGHTLTVKLP